MTKRRLHPSIAFLVLVLAAALAFPTMAFASQAAAAPGADAAGIAQAGVPGNARTRLLDYARTTYASLVAMTNPSTGLPADRMSAAGVQGVETSTTNIGGYMWSTIVAEQLDVVSRAVAVARLNRTLHSLETMERHQPDGQYYNWYDHNTLQKIAFGGPPRLSSVDNGWLAAGLKVVSNSAKETSKSIAARAKAIYDSMDFSVFHRIVYPGGPNSDAEADATGRHGERNGATYLGQHLDRILFHIEPSTGNNPCCYDTMVSESRIATYVGISKNELPDSTYFGQWRTFPDTCDWSWQETKPIGVDRTYQVQGAPNGQVTVFEGAYPYENYLTVPGWGGSMFEALMPNLFVPEEKWAPHSWKINHPGTVEAQIHHGLVDAQYGYWGFSPSDFPTTDGTVGYDVFGVDAIGLNPDGYPSNLDHTFVDHGFAGCRPGQPDPPPSAYTNGIVTPHASFLALRYAPKQVMANLAKLQAIPNMYGQWGFRDSVNVDTKQVDGWYLSLDQSIIMGAIGNALGHDMLRKAFATHEVKAALKPLMATEQFGATRPKSKLLR
jgi:hypothetical protein